MTDSYNINKLSNPSENIKDEVKNFIDKQIDSDVTESQDFELIDSINTEENLIQSNVQISKNCIYLNLKEKNFEIEQNKKKNQLPLNNLNNQTFFNINIKTGNSLLESKIIGNNKEEKLIEDSLLQNAIIQDKKSYEIFSKESLKRKASTSYEKVLKYSKIIKKNSLNNEMYENNKKNSNIIFEDKKIKKLKNVNTNDSDIAIVNKKNILFNTESEKIKSNMNVNENNQDQLYMQFNVLKHSELMKNPKSKINHNIKIKNNEFKKKKNQLFLESNFAVTNNNKIEVLKSSEKLKDALNYSTDELVSMKKNINDKSTKITMNANLEVVNNLKEIKNLDNALNKKDELCSGKKSIKPRMSIEVIYDKTPSKPVSMDLVEINENDEIILDCSQEEINSKSSDGVNLDIETNYKNCTSKSYCKNENNLIQNSGEMIPSIFNQKIDFQNKKNDLIDISNVSFNGKLLENSNQQLDNQIVKEKSNFIPTLKKNGNSIIVTISDSDNSMIDDYGKNKCLNVKLNNENVKTIQLEKEINFNIKLKCLLKIDENTKDICQREIINVLCEQSNITTNLLQQKIVDSSTSTAGLADISTSDNKDSSPASVNSVPQLYNLQPSRLSFVSTVSSSSSASCGLSLVTRKLNKDIPFSYPQWPKKHFKKCINDLSYEEKQNWETFEKLTKDWKNGHLIISAITNFLNNEDLILDCDIGNSDLLETSQILRSSTPEIKVKKNVAKKSTVKNIKKDKFNKQFKNSKIINKGKELHNVFPTPLKPIKEFNTVVHSRDILASEIDNEFLNKNVFAKWSDNNYYPGKVSDIVKEKYKVIFFDGKTKLLLPDFILPIKENLEIGFSAYAYISEDKYASAVIIINIEKRDDATIYIVETDEGKQVETIINNIFLTSDQAKLFREQLINNPSIYSVPQQLSCVTLDNIILNKRRPKRVTKSVIYNSKLEESSINKNKSFDVSMPSISGMQNRIKQNCDDSNKKKIFCNHKEEILLEVQNEIDGTINEQIIKGPLNKVKGKARNRKNQENVEILGPIPEINSNIFNGTSFILSCISPETLIRYQMKHESSDSNSEPGTENEEEWIKRPFVRDYLQAQIVAGGGKIYDNFEDIPPEEYPNTKHITNVPNLTKKSLLCLSVGIRSYNHQWIIRSCQQNIVIQPAEEELPAGWSLDKRTYIDTYQRPNIRPLEHTIVAIPLIELGQSFVDFWKKVCENAGASVQILENPADSFMEATIVLANKNCPFWVIKQASNWQIPILSTTWIMQCLIEGKLCSLDAKKEYKCSVPDSR